MSDANTPVLAAQNVVREYALARSRLGAPRPVLRAVDETSIEIFPGESLGIVGESGSGKTTLCRMLVGQERPSRGEVRYRGQDIWAEDIAMLGFRRSVQMVFQNPRSSFDPRLRVADSLAEPLRGLKLQEDPQRRIAEVLDQVGLGDRVLRRFPHEFSGGQLQRLAIARALVPRPEVLIADEPVSALDVSIQAQVLNLLKDLVRDIGLSLVLIAHDLSVVGYTTTRVAVVADGRIVETGAPADLFTAPSHEVTRRLVGAVLTVRDGLAGSGLA